MVRGCHWSYEGVDLGRPNPHSGRDFREADALRILESKSGCGEVRPFNRLWKTGLLKSGSATLLAKPRGLPEFI